ncbi:hypothetical protein [Pseudomonas sp. A-B-19]|nr:hypothetical protein [Pseudomonas sp. A-B-19]
MAPVGVFSLIFSFSATVYGESTQIPISDYSLTSVPTNPL